MNINKDDIIDKVKSSKELAEYSLSVNKKIELWEKEIENKLLVVNNTTRVKELIEDISEQLLSIFSNDILINKYDAYEYLMKYYEEIFKDDLYMITDTGWIPSLTFAKDKKGTIKKNEFDSELLPKYIIIYKFFEPENKVIIENNNNLDSLTSDFESLVDENTGDESLFKDDDKVNEKLLKDLKKDASDDELIIINNLLDILNNQKKLKKEIKEYQEDLNEKVINKYKTLNEKESQHIIVYDKWFKSLENKFANCLNSLTNTLGNNISKLEEEYESTLSDLNVEIGKKEKELSSLIKELVGDEDDIKALNRLFDDLNGDHYE